MNTQTQEQKSPFRRVKLYHLNDEGKWDDKGTGHVKIIASEMGTHTILVHSEDDGKLLLESQISVDDIYQRQGETLIVWCDPDSGIDMALSFQEDQGCQDIWTQISHIQGRDPNRPMSEDEEEDYDGAISPDETFFQETLTLPEARSENLEEIQRVLTNISQVHKHQLATSITEDYLETLVDLFKQHDDLEDIEKLRIFFEIFKNMVLLNDKNLIELLLSDKFVMPVMGALEYDPELPVTKAEHRDFLKNNVSFKKVGEFSDPVVLSKIHQNYRIMYLKESVLPRALDDPTFNTLNVMIYMNNVEIVNNIQNDDQFLSSLFEKFESNETPHEEIRKGIKFLQELSNLVKSMQAETKTMFYRSLTDHGLFRVIQNTLTNSDIEIRQATSDIIGISLNHNTNLLRSFIMGQSPNYTFLQILCEQVINETDIGIKEQLVEIVKILLETDTFESDRNNFIDVFYDKFVDILVSPIVSEDKNSSLSTEVYNATIVEICELLAFFIQQHSYRSKFYILKNNILSRVTQLLNAESKHIHLAAIRVLRACVGLKEEFYNKYLVKFNLFDPIIEKLKENRYKYNMINSAILELFEFIRKENIRILISHLVEKYKELFSSINYVDTFKMLILKHEQNTEPSSTTTTKPNSSESPYRRTIFDTDEEKYFSEESLDQENGPHGIVDYADEEELTDSGNENNNNNNDDNDAEEDNVSSEDSTNGSNHSIPQENDESKSSETDEEKENEQINDTSESINGPGAQTTEQNVNGDDKAQIGGTKRSLDVMSEGEDPIQSEGKKRRVEAETNANNNL